MGKFEILKKLDQINSRYDGSWMGSNSSKAFLISLGAGPWKEKRRYNVQKFALDWFISKNVSDLKYIEFRDSEKVFPFEWQNKFLFRLINSLHEDNITFDLLCDKWKSESYWEASLKELFSRCGTSSEGSKVLWMFARDFLNIPSFPIDRWVRRTLESNNLPLSPFEMVYLCQEKGINPNSLNRKLFEGVNPDWSNY
jgi:hypothetical protein